MCATKNTKRITLTGAPKLKKNFLKVHFAPADKGGTSFHHHSTPAKVINESGLGQASVDRIFDPTADIVIVQRQLNPQIIEGIKWIQSRGAAVAYQIEDQIWRLPYTSPVKEEYGYQQKQDSYKIINACDAVIVSSDELKRFLSPHNEHIYVLPHILLRKWATRWKPRTKRKDKEVRILLTTTGHHVHDLPIIQHVFKDIAHKYDNVKIVIWGYISQNILNMVPLNRMSYFGWVGINDYYKCFTAMEGDIGVAPLEINNAYNKAKTALKFLEYSMGNMASVVSEIEPYECVEHEKTGMVVHKNKHKYWVDHLSRLIEDEKFRKEIAGNAHQYWLKWHTEDRIVDYIDAYREIIERKKKEDGEKV